MLAGVINFRDAGGYTAADGVMRHGRLFRSGQLTGATTDDEIVLGQLGIATIIDLRRGSERAAFPTSAWADACVTITSDIGGHADPWRTFLREGNGNAPAIRRYLLDFYRSAPFEPRHVDLFAHYFAALADSPGPLLVHCAGGKDRTGLIVALTHSLLGVGANDIRVDYLLTNRYFDFDTHGEAVMRWMSEASGLPVDPAAARAAIEVEAAYLDAAFDTIGASAGTIANYLQSVLGVTPERRKRIVARLIDAR